MSQFRGKSETGIAVAGQQPVWRRAITSVFGAAMRLHHYRDVHDVLLRNVIQEQERRIRKQICCDEKC